MSLAAAAASPPSPPSLLVVVVALILSNSIVISVSASTATTTTTTTTSTLCSGSRFSCAIQSNTSWVFCAGSNDYGQLGLNPAQLESSSTPVLIETKNGQPLLATSISCTASHVCVVTPETSIACWGSSGSGELGVDAFNLPYGFSSTPVHAADTGFAQVCAGMYYTVALDNDGVVWGWGNNAYSVLSAISPNYTLNFGGTNYYTPMPLFGFVSPMQQISCGQIHVCAISTSDQLFCSGFNVGEIPSASFGLVPEPILVPGSWSLVALGSWHTCALSTSNQLWCSGLSNQYQAGSPTKKTRMQLTRVAQNIAAPVTNVWCGGMSTVFSTAFTTTYAFGSNYDAQFGNKYKKTSAFLAPVQLAPSITVTNPVTELVVGPGSILFRVADGQIYGLGDNSDGQLGVGMFGGGGGKTLYA